MAAPKRNVAYDRPSEPNFIKAFKEKIGYKEPDPIDAKFEAPKIDESKLDDREEREDEQPTVVTLKPGDLTQEQYDEIRLIEKNATRDDDTSNESSRDLHDRDNSSDKELPKADLALKVSFKKPAQKRSSPSGISATSKKSKSEDFRKKKVVPSEKEYKTVQNSGLLSFDEEEEG